MCPSSLHQKAPAAWLGSAVLVFITALGCSSERLRRDGTDAGVTNGGAPGARTPASTSADCSPSAPGSVAFSVPSGTFQGTLSVELTSSAGGEIRYTLDRSPPGAESPLYSGTPLLITATTQVRAQVFSGGTPIGTPTTRLYVARSFDQTHDLPVVVLDAYGHGALSQTDRSYVDVAFSLFGLEGGTTTLSALPQVTTHAGFHVRGQSSASFPKTPYRLELRGANDDDQHCALLGMPAESDWALVGPYPDKALIRNSLVYGLGPEIGLKAPRFAPVELYLNVASRPLASSDYLGVYLLLETIKNQKDRIDLRQLKSTDTALPELTGGYIFKFEWKAAEEPILRCTGSTAICWADLELVDPVPPAPEQRDYITQHLQALNQLMHSESFADPEVGYSSYLDVPSWVNHVIVNELTRSMDAYVRSQYFYKDRDAKIFAGPLWDFDLILDVGGYFGNLEIEGWQYQQNADRKTSDWFQRLLSDASFLATLTARWQELRKGVLSDAALNTRIDELAGDLGTAPERNFQRWDSILTASRVGFFTTPTASTWQGQVEAMRDWLLRRAAWLDTQWQ